VKARRAKEPGAQPGGVFQRRGFRERENILLFPKGMSREEGRERC